MPETTPSSQNRQSSCIFPSEPIFGSVPTSISFSGGTPTGPGFERSYILKVPAGNVYTISVSADDFARVSGAGISAESYWDAQNKRIVPGNATSVYAEIPENAEDVLFFVEYRNNGGPYVLSATVTSIRTGVTNVISPSYSNDTSCLLQYTYSLRDTLINSFISQMLEQQGISTLVRLPWHPTEEYPNGWSGSAIPPEIVYAEGDCSVRASVGVDLLSGSATFEVDVFHGGTQADLSVGIQFDTNGNVFVGVTFNIPL